MEKKPLISLISAMTIFGTTGVVKSYIAFPSGFIAVSRSIIGLVFLLVFTYSTGHKLTLKTIRKNSIKLIVSGAGLGINWILLFEAIRYAGVAVATVCYYVAPIIVIAASPFLFGEKFTIKKLLCIASALFGIVAVSGIFDIKAEFSSIGIFLGISAAAFYALVVVVNKTMTDISSHDRITVQFAVSSVVMLIYTLIFEKINASSLNIRNIILLVILGVFHTGIAYMLYFYSLHYLTSQTVSIFSYIDPVVALVASALILKESMSVLQIIGSASVVFSTIIFEFKIKTKNVK